MNEEKDLSRVDRQPKSDGRPTAASNEVAPPPVSESFLRGVVGATTSYTEGWRALAARTLWLEAEVKREQGSVVVSWQDHESLAILAGWIKNTDAAKRGASVEQVANWRRVIDSVEAGAASSPSAESWQPIETAPKMRKIMVHYLNALGKHRCVLACYYKSHSLEMADDYSDVGEYDEESGNSFAPEGWYEEHDSDSPLMRLEGEPDAWMPLPSPPASSQETP